MTTVYAFSLQDQDFIRVCYIVAFSLLHHRAALPEHPRTARRGNMVAAAGMAVAVGATLLDERVGDYGLIALGIALGTAVGVPAARSVKMTAMPQMVALFNGVGGGAVALIAWAEFRDVGRRPPTDVIDPARLRGDRRLGLLLGLEHRVREAPGDPPGPPDPAAGTAVRQRCCCCSWRWAARWRSPPARSRRGCSS